jgi:geranylgeranyl pyrophosphate synthase
VDEHTIEHARAFGYEIGMAFQIVDDVLDFTGEMKTVGKPLANDLRQGVITLPTLFYMQINPEDSNLHAYLNGNLYNGSGMDSLIESIRQSGAIQHALDDAQGYAERGLDQLSYLPECPEHAALEDLTRYIVRRQL